ncbi:MAG: HAMP domain-containing histidine kinase, partial [Candidatus Kapabacteria bacterium]|nr:HAMP domain-containing histidine kinase [Candidatus Kapabacteria bacterium]
NDIIQNAKDSIALQVDAKGGIVHCNMEAEYPFVFADEMHIRNVMLNLLDNAIKYTTNEPVLTITSRNVEGGVNVTVRDNGIGITKENQKRVFEKLYRVPTGNVHNVKGFGLGLSYAKAIVDAHGGDISVSSEFGEGSEFTIFIPYGNMV